MAQKASIAALPGFSSLGLNDRLVKAILELGYEEPTPIQREAIPPLLEGKDLVGQAATGTGNTAAFALPLLHKLATGEQRGLRPMAIVLVPTRELAMQVAEAVHRYGRPLEASVLPFTVGRRTGRSSGRSSAGPMLSSPRRDGPSTWCAASTSSLARWPSWS
jgi:ATP-dependent RNA helicase DeaD